MNARDRRDHSRRTRSTIDCAVGSSAATCRRGTRCRRSGPSPRSSGVNRHAIREALKRLQQAGLIRISQGGATRVLDWRDHGRTRAAPRPDGPGRRAPRARSGSVLEMRASVGVDVARRCAERAGAEERAAVVESRRRAAADRSTHGAADVVEAYVNLWQLIVAGSANLAYRLALNSLNAALAAYPQLGETLAPRDATLLRELGDAIGVGGRSRRRGARPLPARGGHRDRRRNPGDRHARLPTGITSLTGPTTRRRHA